MLMHACDCTRGLCGHCKRVCTENLTLGENSLAAPGTRTGVRTVLRQPVQSDAVPNDLPSGETDGIKVHLIWRYIGLLE